MLFEVKEKALAVACHHDKTFRPEIDGRIQTLWDNKEPWLDGYKTVSYRRVVFSKSLIVSKAPKCLK